MEPEILLVEDNPADALLFGLMLAEANPNFYTRVARSGPEGLNLLAAGNRAGKHSRPSIVVLDLNLPGFNGFEFLKVVKGDPKTASIPIVVFTSSTSKEDRDLCYRLGANSYLTKPVNLDSYCEIIQSLCNFWLHWTSLPELTDWDFPRPPSP